MLKLSDLLSYNNIVVQCHNNPDADTIASGYALYSYFKSFNKNVRILYSGPLQISKPNLIAMVENLHIPLEYVSSLENVDLLITVDCQYGAGNVTKLPAKNVAIIDHHTQEVFDIDLIEIRSYLSSCSTLVWDLLRDENFDVNKSIDISSALYYGLLSDTNNFVEISHPLDRDMRDTLIHDDALIKLLKSSNLSLIDLETAGVALLRYSHNSKDKFAIFKSNPCDPNILGFISDLAIQVNSINTCVVFSELSSGIRLSVRSCIPEVMANELASFLCEDIGSGGGHLDKAGGFISTSSFNQKFGGINMEAYLLNRIREYYDSFDIIFNDTYNVDISTFTKYVQKILPIGYVKSSNIYVKSTPILIRTLDGDMNSYTADDLYIMIGLKGEVFYVTREFFENNYIPCKSTFVLSTDYDPHIKNKLTGESLDLRLMANSCVQKRRKYIYIKELTKNIKLFFRKDPHKYTSGKMGDFLVVNADDFNDISIIDKKFLNFAYEKVL